MKKKVDETVATLNDKPVTKRFEYHELIDHRVRIEQPGLYTTRDYWKGIAIAVVATWVLSLLFAALVFRLGAN